MIESILIIDDSPIIAKGLSLLLKTNQKIKDVFSALDKNEANRLLETNKIQLAIVDLDFETSEYDGMQIIKSIKKKHPFLKIIVFTYHVKIEYVRYLFDELEVDGFLNKLIDDTELFESIQAASIGERYIAQEIQQMIEAGTWKKITEREKEILEALSNGLTQKQIANKFNISINTVESHIVNLREKIGASNTPELTSKYSSYKTANHEMFDQKIPPFRK